MSQAVEAKVEVKLFGPPRFVVDGEAQPLPEKAFVLLAILAASEQKTANRSHIRSILWGDFDRDLEVAVPGGDWLNALGRRRRRSASSTAARSSRLTPPKSWASPVWMARWLAAPA